MENDYLSEPIYKIIGITEKIFSIVIKLSTIFIIVVLGVIYVRFTFSDGLEYQKLDNSLYTLLILVALIFANYFSSIEIGNYIKLKKEVGALKSRGDELSQESKENREAISRIQNQVLSLSFTSQWTSSISGKNIVNIDTKPIVQSQPANIEPANNRLKKERVRYIEKDWLTLQKYAIQKALQNRNISNEGLKSNVQILPSSTMFGDPISNRNVLIDGYIESLFENQIFHLFFEVRNLNDIDTDKYDRLNIILDKIFFNYTRNSKNAKLIILLLRTELNPVIDEDVYFQFNNTFSPAIGNGLLETKVIDITKDEFEKLNINFSSKRIGG